MPQPDYNVHATALTAYAIAWGFLCKLGEKGVLAPQEIMAKGKCQSDLRPLIIDNLVTQQWVSGTRIFHRTSSRFSPRLYVLEKQCWQVTFREIEIPNWY